MDWHYRRVQTGTWLVPCSPMLGPIPDPTRTLTPQSPARPMAPLVSKIPRLSFHPSLVLPPVHLVQHAEGPVSTKGLVRTDLKQPRRAHSSGPFQVLMQKLRRGRKFRHTRMPQLLVQSTILQGPTQHSDPNLGSTRLCRPGEQYGQLGQGPTFNYTERSIQAPEATSWPKCL